MRAPYTTYQHIGRIGDTCELEIPEYDYHTETYRHVAVTDVDVAVCALLSIIDRMQEEIRELRDRVDPAWDL